MANITQGSGENAMNYGYEYDNRGNITSETLTRGSGTTAVTKVTTYEYDAIGQLIRVNDPNDPMAGTNGTTWIYEYDRGGNIQNKMYYAYTDADNVSGDPIGTMGYEYDTAWKDKLISFNGQTITHNSIGNMTSDGE